MEMPAAEGAIANVSGAVKATVKLGPFGKPTAFHIRSDVKVLANEGEYLLTALARSLNFSLSRWRARCQALESMLERNCGATARPPAANLPAASTIGEILKRGGLTIREHGLPDGMRSAPMQMPSGR
jgi:hypothetical protein